MKISRKIFAITFLISSIAIAGIAILTLSRTTSPLHELSRQRLQEGVNREASIVTTTFNMVKADLQMLADEVGRNSQTPGARDRPKLADSIAMLMRKRPAYLRIALSQGGEGGGLAAWQNAFGVRTSLEETRPDPDLAALFEQLEKRPGANALFSSVIRRPAVDDSATTIRIIAVAIPIVLRAEHRTIGMVGMVMDFDALIAGFGRQRSDINFFIGDMEGRYLYRPFVTGESLAVGTNAVDDFHIATAWGKWLSETGTQLRIDDDARGLSLAAERIALSDVQAAHQMIVVGGIASLAEVEAEVRRYRNQLALIALGVGALLAMALAFATSHLTRPIKELTQVANSIATREHDITTEAIHRNDEFGVLARAMMRMLDTLRDSAKHEEQAALGRMATMIAHDVRNALSSVKMNLKILHTHHHRLDDEYADGCDIALEQIGYMENILTDMLDFARPRGLEMDWVDLAEAFKIATMSLLPEIAEKSIVLCDAHQSLPKLFGDRTRLIQVFQNLLANAIQSMGEFGHLTIDIQSTLHQSRPAVRIDIIDTGAGIPLDMRTKVFEPFITTRAKGTGLGLTIVNRVVRDHGGEISLEDNPQGGTIARVVLPLTPADWQQDRDESDV